LPYCIENVVGARDHLISPLLLCGTMFGLETPDEAFELQRHRLFETSFPIDDVPACRHSGHPVIGIYGGHFRDRRRDAGENHRSGSNIPREHGFFAMGVPLDSMTNDELSEAIPPAYAQYIAEAFLRWRAATLAGAEAVRQTG
jgi:DNA (cytosine-5)-methyltransferase 1